MVNVNNLIEFGVILVVSFLGALANDYYNTLKNTESKINISRISLSAITGAIVFYGISDRLKGIDDRLFTLLSFVFGAGGFSLFGMIQRLDLKKMFFGDLDTKEKEE